MARCYKYGAKTQGRVNEHVDRGGCDANDGKSYLGKGGPSAVEGLIWSIKMFKRRPSLLILSAIMGLFLGLYNQINSGFLGTDNALLKYSLLLVTSLFFNFMIAMVLHRGFDAAYDTDYSITDHVTLSLKATPVIFVTRILIALMFAAVLIFGVALAASGLIGILGAIGFIIGILFLGIQVALVFPAIVYDGNGSIDAITKSWGEAKGIRVPLFGLVLLGGITTEVVSAASTGEIYPAFFIVAGIGGILVSTVELGFGNIYIKCQKGLKDSGRGRTTSGRQTKISTPR